MVLITSADSPNLITVCWQESPLQMNTDLLSWAATIPILRILEKYQNDLSVDSVFPEITTCYDVPQAVGDRVVWGFPIDKFVSYGSRLTLLIYAYGAYVNLNKSEFKLVARPSHSAGLIVSCPIITTDGYFGLHADVFSADVILPKRKNLRSVQRQIFSM